MIDSDLALKLDELGARIDRAYESAEKVRKYIFWTGVVTAALVLLPAIGLMFVIPQFLSSYTAALDGSGY